ncbi:MAG: EVE domain-containing protein [Betaproteobacteria bacterium]|jgi:Uncharacterized conserved protein|nr:EVE domain-containing protein [Betaproteobacteria bacterium]
MKYWLMKSEPSEVSVEDVLAMPNQTVEWFGVRNYQARNFMLREMQVGDGVLFYHSSCAQPGIVGVARIARAAQPDMTQFDPESPYFDSRSSADKPRWFCVAVKVERKTRCLDLVTLRRDPDLAQMRVLAKGNRLSITPVAAVEWERILAYLGVDWETL